MATSKSSKPSWIHLREVLAADHVGAGRFGLGGLGALREDRDLDVLAESVGQCDRAAQLLVGVAHVEAGAHVHLDGLVELGAREILDEGDRPCAGSYSCSRSTFARDSLRSGEP